MPAHHQESFGGMFSRPVETKAMLQTELFLHIFGVGSKWHLHFERKLLLIYEQIIAINQILSPALYISSFLIEFWNDVRMAVTCHFRNMPHMLTLHFRIVSWQHPILP